MRNFVSIIIPIHELNNQFQKTFNNLINQSYRNFEIILIVNNQNDEDILNNLINNPDNIIIVSKNFDNDGDAWNIGLEYSNGDYVLFFNQYSVINELVLEKFLWNVNVSFDIISSNYIGKNDLFYDYNNDYLFKNFINNYDDILIDSDNIYKSIFQISNNVNIKLFNKDFLLKHNLLFETEFLFHEELFYYVACFKSTNILLINDDNLNLISSAPLEFKDYSNNFEQYLVLNKRLLEYFQNHTLCEYFGNIFSQILVLNVLKRYYQFDENDKFKLFNLTKDLLIHSKRWIFKDITPSFKLLITNFINSNNHEEENVLNFYFKNHFKRKTKISVIIPVFKNSKYISKCLDSLLNQTLTDIEIICIEDRGKDESYDILKEYAKKDSRIKLRSNETSKGFGFSKNVGLDFAIGEFVLFIDIKNVLPSDKLEKIYYFAKLQQVDMLICPIVSSGDLLTNFKKSIFDFKDVINNEKLFEFMVFSTNVFYNASFLSKNNIKFNEDIKLEDALFFIESILHAKRVSFYHSKCHYLKNRHFNWKYNNRFFITFFDDVFNLFRKRGCYEKYKKKLFRFKINMCNSVFNKLEDNNKKRYYNILHNDFEKFNFDFKSCLDKNMISFVETVKSKTFEEYSLENTINKIKKDNDEFRGVNKTLVAKNVQLTNVNDELNRDVDRLTNDYVRLSCLNDELCGDVGRLTEVNIQLTNSNDELNENISRLTDENLRLSSLNDELNGDVDRLADENLRLSCLNDELNGDVARLANENAQLSSLSKELVIKNDFLKSKEFKTK